MIWGLVGLSGAVYEVSIVRQMRTQTVYRPVFEDWLFHAILPLGAYLAMAGSAFAAASHLDGALAAVAVAALVLLFAGIHNAWDAATYHIFVVSQRHEQSERPR